MAELKTQRTGASVTRFLKGVDSGRRADCKRIETLMKKLGKHKHGKSCLYIKKLDDVDMPTLEGLIDRSVSHMCKASV